MIYIQQGLKTNELREIKTTLSSFEWLEQYNVQVVTEQDKTTKSNIARYFISGYIEPNENGKYQRNNDSLIRRDLLLLDYDDIALTEKAFIEHINERLKDYNYILYPTFSHTTEKPRYRLVVDIDRPLGRDDYLATLTEVANLINLPSDHSATTWAQLQGLPITTNRVDYNMIINKGKPYKGLTSHNVVVRNNKFVEITEKDLQIDVPKQREWKPSKDYIEHDKAIAIMQEYVKREYDNLQDYTNALSGIAVLAKSFQHGEIDHSTALDCLDVLALGNAEWKKENLYKFNHFLQNTVRSKWSFKDKFGYQPKIVKMSQLYLKLERVGEDWRTENRKVNEKTGEVKIPIMQPHTIANILNKYHYFVLLGDNKDKSLIYSYDLDNGIYIASDTVVDKMIFCLEYRTSINGLKLVKTHLKTMIPLELPLSDKNLIPVNNGIFDIENQKLLPFHHGYYITSKIVTNYNAKAKPPEYFNVEDWFYSLACGDGGLVQVLWEMINEAINPNYTRKKIGFLIGKGESGKGSNGKGTFQSLLINLIGKNNIASLKPPEFSERFKLPLLIGKVCNIGDDISDAYIDDISNLMSIATGDVITGEDKGVKAQNLFLQTFCLFSGNDMPRVRNKSGWHRRALIVPFNADFSGDNDDPKIKEVYVKDKQVLEYVLKKVLSLKFEKFTISKTIIETLEEYEKHNDYTLAYIDEVYITNGYHDFSRIPLPFPKNDFQDFLEREGIKQFTFYGFGKEFVKKLSARTGRKYTIEKGRLTSDLKEQLPPHIRIYIKDGANNYIKKTEERQQ